MARASLPIETPPLPVPEVLPAPYQAFLVALDRLVDAMDKAVERAPKKAIERLKRAREFGARASIGHDDRARAPYAAPPVRLRGYNGLATAQAPWVDPTDYGPKPDTMTAHAYMARPLHLLDALVAAQAAALDASLALVAAPHLGRATLSVDVAPRTKNGAVRKVGLALGRTPLEPTREHMDKITGDCLWSDVGGARPRLVAYLRAIAAVPPPAPDAPYWIGERLAVGRTMERVIADNHRSFSWYTCYVQAHTAQDAATLMEARHRLLSDRDQPPPVSTPHWVVHRAETAVPLPPL